MDYTISITSVNEGSVVSWHIDFKENNRKIDITPEKLDANEQQIIGVVRETVKALKALQQPVPSGQA